MRLKGKTAFITGGNSGIGLATAKRFVDEGARVAITGRNTATLDEAAKALGPNAIAFRADTTNLDQLSAAVAETVEQFGKLDIVFANAGISGSTPIDSATAESFERILSTNVTGVFLTIQAAAAHLNDGASIIFNGSVHSVAGIPGYASYAASKGAVSSMSRVLASELAPRKIRVNVVSPGATRTPIWGDRLEATEGFIANSTLLARFGEAEEVANTVLFLASDEASNITATELFVDGGFTGAPLGAPIYRR